MPRALLYRLEGTTPVEERYPSATSGPRNLKRTTVGDAEVSTAFLSVDHNFHDHGPPILFEVMVFGGKLDEHQQRFHTYAEAIQEHDRLVWTLRNDMGINPEEEAESSPVTWYQKLLEDDAF